MTRLGDVLELIYSGPDERITVHAVVREGRDADVARQAQTVSRILPGPRSNTLAVRAIALAASAMGLRSRLAGRQRSSSVPGPMADSVLEVWLDASGIARLERTWTVPDGTERFFSVLRPSGERTFPSPDDRSFDVRRDQAVAASHWPAPSSTDTDRLFSHPQLRDIIGCLELDPLGEGTIAGRSVVRARAVPRPGANLWPHWLPPGADDYELAFDEEHGHLLAWVARIDGRPFESSETHEIRYGGEIDPSLLEPPTPA